MGAEDAIVFHRKDQQGALVLLLGTADSATAFMTVSFFGIQLASGRLRLKQCIRVLAAGQAMPKPVPVFTRLEGDLLLSPAPVPA